MSVNITIYDNCFFDDFINFYLFYVYLITISCIIIILQKKDKEFTVPH